MIRIRPYRDEDEAVILTWCRDEDSFYKWTFGVLGEYPLTAEKFRSLSKHARFVALDEEGVAGFFIVRNPGQKLDELRIGYVIVDPARRGRGVGKEMLRGALSYAFSIYQAGRVSLGVFENNRPAFACYKAVGFEKTGGVETYTIRGQRLEVVEMAVTRTDHGEAEPRKRITPVDIQVVRAEAEWQRAGAYAVRIEGMNRQHHISLREEFDEHDGDGTRYIVLLDGEYPFATCRFFPVGEKSVAIGRVVVLPQYRGGAYGRRTLQEAEGWIRECGYEEILVDARIVATGFYEKLGYEIIDGSHFISGPFECVQMRKGLR